MAAYEVRGESGNEKRDHILKAANRIKNTRPTQTSLHYLVDEMVELMEEELDGEGEVFDVLRNRAWDWTEHIMEVSKKLGEHVSEVIDDGDTILTHCYGGPAIYSWGITPETREGDRIFLYRDQTLSARRPPNFFCAQSGRFRRDFDNGRDARSLHRGRVD